MFFSAPLLVNIKRCSIPNVLGEVTLQKTDRSQHTWRRFFLSNSSSFSRKTLNHQKETVGKVSLVIIIDKLQSCEHCSNATNPAQKCKLECYHCTRSFVKFSFRDLIQNLLIYLIFHSIKGIAVSHKTNTAMQELRTKAFVIQKS